MTMPHDHLGLRTRQRPLYSIEEAQAFDGRDAEALSFFAVVRIETHPDLSVEIECRVDDTGDICGVRACKLYYGEHAIDVPEKCRAVPDDHPIVRWARADVTMREMAEMEAEEWRSRPVESSKWRSEP